MSESIDHLKNQAHQDGLHGRLNDAIEVKKFSTYYE
jgi:hypothetical protein